MRREQRIGLTLWGEAGWSGGRQTCMAEGRVSLSSERISLVNVLALGLPCCFLPEAAWAVSMVQGPPRRQEATGGVGLCTAPLPVLAQRLPRWGRGAEPQGKPFPGKSLPGFSVSCWESKSLSPACLSKAVSWGHLSMLAPSRGARKGWGVAAGNCFSLAVPGREGPSRLGKKWAGFYGKGKSLKCRRELFMEQIKGPDSLFVVCINIVKAER